MAFTDAASRLRTILLAWPNLPDDEVNRGLAMLIVGMVAGFAVYFPCHFYEPTAFGFLVLVASFNMSVVGFLFISVRYAREIAVLAVVYNIGFWVTLGSSIVIYRLWLNPLRKYPGPFWARITKLVAVDVAAKGYTHLWLENLHNKYGDIVRVAPNELSYRNIESLPHIHGNQSTKMAKGPWYDGIPNQPADSMASTRDLAEHKSRRRIWDRGFSPKALSGYERRILTFVNLLSKQLRARTNSVINFSDWCDFFAFDVMGDLGFGADFGMLIEAKPHIYMVFMHNALRMLAMFSHIPWSKPLIPLLPMDQKTKDDSRMFFKFCEERYLARRKQGTDRDDVFSYLLDGNEGSRPLDDAQLAADAGVIVVGGADTTSVCLTFIFYRLCKNPSTMKRLQEEVDTIWNSEQPQNGPMWAQASYLNAVINEALRMNPPGPNGMQRTVPKGGCVITGDYLPQGTQLSTHGWSILRDARYFSKPTEFIPERWIEKERPNDFNHETRAFIPFSIGQYGCIGKNLALLEMRLFVAEIVKRFDIVIDSSFDEEAFHGAAKSNLSLLKGDLPLVLTERVVAL